MNLTFLVFNVLVCIVIWGMSTALRWRGNTIARMLSKFVSNCYGSILCTHSGWRAASGHDQGHQPDEGDITMDDYSLDWVPDICARLHKHAKRRSRVRRKLARHNGRSPMICPMIRPAIMRCNGPAAACSNFALS